MSESDLSEAPLRKPPSAAALEKALRRETEAQSDDALMTVNTVRRGVEKALGLETEFLSSDAWKARSKQIIKTELDILQGVDASNSRPGSAKSTPVKPKAAQPTTKVTSKKRPSPALEKPPQKRQKKSLPIQGSEGEGSPSAAEDGNAKNKKSSTKKAPAKVSKHSLAVGKPQSKIKKRDPDSDLSDTHEDDSDSLEASEKPDNDSGSEMSVLIDDEPRQKKKRKTTAKPAKVAKSKVATEDDPDQEEIKRLQGWLVKCGIRKIWAFELKPYETSKAKISHLKAMLSEVGMTGRFSLEKASEIKEARELAADIEAVQEGNEIWGKDGEERSRRSRRSDYAGTEDDPDEEDDVPKKKLVRGPKRFDFLSSESEESDWEG